MRISVDTPIPVSDGEIDSITFLLYALNPLCESERLSFIEALVIFVITFMPNFLYVGIFCTSSKNLEPITISHSSSFIGLRIFSMSLTSCCPSASIVTKNSDSISFAFRNILLIAAPYP